MGVPKFYRWTSERYPCLSQVIREHQIPEFDNLYLDMNGIIHVCSHPNDDDPHFRISEAEIFKNIFHYIEVLFRIIKPQRNFFMAVDGVAPRAKMNQQRGRRFRTAKEAQENIRRALQKGEKLPKEERFDSNCITPGTDFMARLNDQLQYFVNMKVSSDPLWQTCNIFLSGHDVPGEGEHKIMDFIRYEKAKEDYDANTRHCLYGLDADLIMLGLVSHEPHFSLLREEVRFGKQSKRVTKPEETVFHLLHLSLMREYLDFEFSALKDTLPFKYDLERLIDDWVLLGFLVGNDFIPHLPNMHINQDAMPYLYRVYIETMPKLDGYLHDSGILNLSRFQKFLDALAKFDRDRFEDEYSDMKWLEGKMGRSVSPRKKRDNGKKLKFSQLVSQVDDDIMMPVRNPYMALANVSDAFDDSLVSSPQRNLDGDDMENDELESRFSGLGFKDTEGGEDIFEMEFRQHKRAYYIEKFDIPVADDEFIAKVAFEFILAIQWNLHYYYNGIQSWSWYYPFHYSPYISDLVNIESFDLNMEKAKPFRPFEQLLAVLPSYSRKLLPEAFQSLMVMDTSPIIDYYPTEFRTDLNGKQQEWEAVVLIPFIQEQRLLSAMAPNYARLTDEEKHRNSFGKCLKYRYSKNVNFKFTSTYPGEFRDIDVCRASCEKLDMDEFRIDIRDIKQGLCDGVQLDVYFPGFPTLKHLDHVTELRKAGVRVFSYSSKGKNMIININEVEKPDYETMRSLVGTVVHVEWPYLVEALVTGITDGERKFIWKEHENVVHEDIMNKNKITDATNWMKIVRTNSVDRKGIDPGVVNVLVEAKLLKGKRYVCGPKGVVKNEKEWAPTHSFFPYQAVVQDLTVHKSMYQKDVDSIEDLYPVGSQCFMMASPHYGCSGEVLEIDHQASRVRVSLSVPPEPDFSDVITNQTGISDRYYSFESAARKVGISSKLLSRITGSIFVAKNGSSGNSDRANLGLKLKFSGQNREVIGYARRDEDGWKFSETAVDVLCSYVQRFPGLFEKLSRLREQECYNEDVLFSEEAGEDSLEDVLAFLKGLACTKIDAVKCGSTFLDEKIVAAIEDAVEGAKTERHLAKCVKVKVKPYVLFRPTAEFGSLVADPSTDYYLFDRVVNIRDNGAVPLGYRGTIIGVHEVKEDAKNDDSPSELKYEVLFDEPFLGGLKLRCEQNKGAYMTSSSLLSISYGERKEVLKRGYSPSNITRLQGKAEPREMKTPSSASREFSPFSPPRSRDRYKEGTPTGRLRESPAYRGGSPQRGNSAGRYGSGSRYQGSGSSSGYGEMGDDQLKSPDYWLKGYGRGGARDKFSPQGNRDYKSPKQDGFKVLDREPTKDRPAKDDEFNALLMKLTGKENKTSSVKASKQQPQTDAGSPTTTSKSQVGAKNVDKEGTALLQQLLSIKQQSPQPKDGSKKQEIPSTPPQRAPSNTILNQLFQSPEPSSPLMNIPASPTSPLVPGANPPPTKALQSWCHENHMPAPSYTYSCTPQGVHAVVKIGPALCYGGLMNRSKNEAAESAAANALGNLMQRHAQIAAAKQPNNPVAPIPGVQGPHWPPVFMGHRHATPGIAQHPSPGFVRLPEQQGQQQQQQQHPVQLRHQSPIQLAQQQAWTNPGQPGVRMQQMPVMNQSAMMMQRGAMMPQVIFQQQQQHQQLIMQHQLPRVALHQHPNPHPQQMRSPVMEIVPQNLQQKAQSASFHKSPTEQMYEKPATKRQHEAANQTHEEMATGQMVDVSKPAFIPLQVNRKNKAASNKEQKAETDKETETLDVANITQRKSPNLMSFEDNTIEPKPSNKTPIRGPPHFTADNSAQEPATQIQDAVALTDSPSARSQSSPSYSDDKLPRDLTEGEKVEQSTKQKKDKGGRKNILLAPSFFAPKK